MPLSLYLLALAVFAMGTSEFMLAGLLPDIASDLDVTVGDLRRPQVDHDLATAGTDLEGTGGGPVTQPLCRVVVGMDLDRGEGGGGLRGAHSGAPFKSLYSYPSIRV